MTDTPTLSLMEEGRSQRNTLPVVEVIPMTAEAFFEELSRRAAFDEQMRAGRVSTPAPPDDVGDYPQPVDGYSHSVNGREALTQEHDSLNTSVQEEPALTTAESRQLVYSLSGVVGVLERMHDDFDRAIELLTNARDALELTPACRLEYDQIASAQELLNIINQMLTDKINRQMAMLSLRLRRYA